VAAPPAIGLSCCPSGVVNIIVGEGAAASSCGVMAPDRRISGAGEFNALDALEALDVLLLSWDGGREKRGPPEGGVMGDSTGTGELVPLDGG
jgi:hypothetical protein